MWIVACHQFFNSSSHAGSISEFPAIKSFIAPSTHRHPGSYPGKEDILILLLDTRRLWCWRVRWHERSCSLGATGVRTRTTYSHSNSKVGLFPISSHLTISINVHTLCAFGMYPIFLCPCQVEDTTTNAWPLPLSEAFGRTLLFLTGNPTGAAVSEMPNIWPLTPHISQLYTCSGSHAGPEDFGAPFRSLELAGTLWYPSS